MSWTRTAKDTGSWGRSSKDTGSWDRVNKNACDLQDVEGNNFLDIENNQIRVIVYS